MIPDKKFFKSEKSHFWPPKNIDIDIIHPPLGGVFIDVYKESSLTIINKKTHLGKVVSLLKGFECYFYTEDKKAIFDLKIEL